MDQCFLESKAIADNVEGMLSPFSMAVMDSVLSFQAARGVKGDIVELGVYRGKSATILSGRLSVGEQLHLGCLSATLRTFKCDKRQTHHDVVDLQTKIDNCRTRLSWNNEKFLAREAGTIRLFVVRFCG